MNVKSLDLGFKDVGGGIHVSADERFIIDRCRRRQTGTRPDGRAVFDSYSVLVDRWNLLTIKCPGLRAAKREAEDMVMGEQRITEAFKKVPRSALKKGVEEFAYVLPRDFHPGYCGRCGHSPPCDVEQTCMLEDDAIEAVEGPDYPLIMLFFAPYPWECLIGAVDRRYNEARGRGGGNMVLDRATGRALYKALATLFASEYAKPTQSQGETTKP